MESKELLRKIAAIYEVDPDKGTELLKMLYKANYGDDEDYEGLSIVDDPDESGEEEDPAAKWLAEQESKGSGYSGEWKPSEDLTDQHKADIENYMNDGYSMREAHRMAGAHKELDFASALKSRVNPSMMSDRHIDHMKGLAKEWLENADKYEKLNADIEKNPMKHASGRMMAAHDEHMGDYKKAYNEFLNSEELKGLSRRERHKAVTEWKKNYRAENEDHSENIANASEAGKSLDESRKTIKESLQDKMANIISGGFAPGETYSTQEGAQHAGIELGGEGEKPTGSIQKDPLSSFAGSNQKLVGMLSDEQKQRFDRINSARATQGGQAAQAPRTIIRRKKDGQD